MDTEEDISSAKIKKQRGCREKLLEIRCRVYRIRHTRIRHEADGEDKPKMVSKEEEKRMKQDSAGQFSQCNRCGARIMWVKTKAGKNMPVDPQFVDFKKIKGGKERLVLPSGEVVAGERCKAKEADGYGYISHFATCPGYRR